MASGSGLAPEVAIVTGAASALGRRVATLAAEDPAIGRVVALDRAAPSAPVPGVEPHAVDLAVADLKTLFEGATTVVHLAEVSGPEAPEGEVVGDGALARRVLDAVSAVGAQHVVLLSSAIVYGAWANNPVPITEDAPLRPNPGVVAASEKAELERTAAEWRDAHPSSTVAILRPTVTVSAEGNGWLARALDRSTSLPVADEEPPAQFLDVDDLANAIDLARRERLDGPRNVAPDGWISGDTVRSLAGGPPRVRLPERVALQLARVRWRWRLAPTPPSLLPLTVHPWVIANDRLKADGWQPTSSNEEAYVGSHRAGPWATLSPRRRQELALGAAGATLVGGAALGVAALRRRR
jgi:nucleoside-diphosphate-sugar epimerase